MRWARARTLVGVALALVIVGPLAWMWWDSRLPSTYSVMDIGTLDYGGGPRSAGGHHSAAPAQQGGTSVVDLDTKTKRKPDVVVSVTARQGEVTLASGRVVDGYSFNNTSPGPLIEATVGDLIEVRLTNESVKDGVALHWHGVDVPNAQDGVAGVTQDSVGVGEKYTYRWIAPDAGTYWYHSHQMSNEQVIGGLLGGIVIRPEVPETDVQDVVGLSHLYDSKPTINGLPGAQDVSARPGQRVRVRLVNTDNGSQVAWTNAPFLLRAVDGFDVNAPTRVSGRSVGIPAGGRVDLEMQVPVDGSALRVQLLGGIGMVIGPPDSSAQEPREPAKELDLLDYGSAAPIGFDVSKFDRDFRYDIGRRPGFLNGRPGLWWTVNGRIYKEMPMMVVREGDVARMRISNNSGKVHPVHLHGHHVVVLSRNGVKATGSPWWVDSLDVKDGDTYEVAFLADNPGIWMDHCHNLKHAGQGLVTHVMYDGVSTPYRLGKGSGNTPE